LFDAQAMRGPRACARTQQQIPEGRRICGGLQFSLGAFVGHRGVHGYRLLAALD
jgi:hypothetical protein